MSEEINAAIAWKDWDDALASARAAGKPVLLALTATWCHWCHVMDRTSYSDPRIINLVNSAFVPARVDVDQRPDLSARYNQGGFPSVAILDASGGLISGRIYTAPDEMVQWLEGNRSPVARAAPVAPPKVKETVAPRTRYSPSYSPAENPNTETERVVDRLCELYDPRFGGFGLEPKQPPWDAVKLLMTLYSRSRTRRLLDMAVRTLDGIKEGLYDQCGGGFFRYSVSRDWKVPHYEKMLLTNASLGQVYLEAHQLTGKATYKQAASGALDYLLENLYDPAATLFCSSQDADEEYYRLPWKDRTESLEPSIDRVSYTGWNAAAASALIRAAGLPGGGAYLKQAGRVLDTIWNQAYNPSQGISHTLLGATAAPQFLADQVQVCQALLDLYQTTGDPEALRRATDLERVTGKLFISPDGATYNSAVGGVAPIDANLQMDRPVVENSNFAQVQATLYWLTGEGEYLESSRATMEAFQDTVPGSSYLGPPGLRRMEEDEERLFLPAGAAWAKAWDLVNQGPVHMVLVGKSDDPRWAKLLRTAQRIHAPHRLIQPLDIERDNDRITSLGFPIGQNPVMYLCTNGVCLAPIDSPAELRRLTTHGFGPWMTHLDQIEE